MHSKYHHMAKEDLGVLAASYLDFLCTSYLSYIQHVLGYDKEEMSADIIAALA